MSKAQAALEVLSGDMTLAELAAKHRIRHTMIASRKRQAIEGDAGADRTEGRNREIEAVLLANEDLAFGRDARANSLPT